MKRRMKSKLLLVVLMLGGVARAAGPVDSVETRTGTDSTFAFSRGNTHPETSRPFPMTAWAPQNADTPRWFYYWRSNTIQGVRSTHQPSVWIADYGSITIMPMTGAPQPAPQARASEFSHDEEVARPDYYRVRLARYDTTLEVTATRRCAMFRFTFPATNAASVLLDGQKGGGVFQALENGRKFVGAVSNFNGDMKLGFAAHVVAEFNAQPAGFGMTKDNACRDGATEISGGRVGVFAKFDATGQRTVLLRVGTSFISREQAALNLKREISGWDFEALRAEASKEWNAALGRVELEGATPEQRGIFYTALFRAISYPHTWYELDASGKPQHFGSGDGKVHPGVLYTDNGFWDTFRAQYPLLALLYPERTAEIVQGFLNLAQENGGWLPLWPGPGYIACMIGTHADSVIADALAKGVTNFDLTAACNAVLKDGDEVPPVPGRGRQGVADYVKLGYVPADIRVEHATARTLEFAYDDFCIAQITRAAGRTAEAERFLQRAHNYRNVFDPAVGFMRGRNRDGKWSEPFDPLAWGNPFIEGNAWQYTWSVQQDPYGLMKLFGGADKLAAKLDEMLAMPGDFHVGSYGKPIHEMTEAQSAGMGQYAHNNEPVHHALYLYDFAGQPWKAQKWVRQTCEKLYGPAPGGLLGDEDTGQTSAWYVFSALGFYPFCPGHPSYVIGAPLFPRATLHLPNGKTLTIVVKGDVAKAPYIQDAKLNGEPFTRTWLGHAELLRGGTLEFTMGAEPNRAWGSAESARPPDFMKEK
jgi:predicted alpha-1,2-mannosidase